jgi:hypothetical protein
MNQNLASSQARWLTLVIPATWELKSGGLRFKVSLGKKSSRDPISKNKKPGTVVHSCQSQISINKEDQGQTGYKWESLLEKHLK